VLLAYPVIGSVGEVGEIIVSGQTEEILSHTSIDEMLARARALFDQHRDEIQAPFHKQETLYSCVSACPRMMFAAFGVDVTEADLRAACDCTLAGTDSLQAVDAARSYGFKSSSFGEPQQAF
jgi:hypothetical protein